MRIKVGCTHQQERTDALLMRPLGLIANTEPTTRPAALGLCTDRRKCEGPRYVGLCEAHLRSIQLFPVGNCWCWLSASS
jgi:hypothetical protein